MSSRLQGMTPYAGGGGAVPSCDVVIENLTYDELTGSTLVLSGGTPPYIIVWESDEAVYSHVESTESDGVHTIFVPNADLTWQDFILAGSVRHPNG